MRILKKFLYRLRGEVSTEDLVKSGLKIGSGFHRMNEVWIDPGHAWLITFGDNVTLAPRVTVLAHDASPQAFRQVTKIGQVKIGNNVFIGAGSIILPGVTIGDNVIIGAGSVVTKDIPSDTVATGNPCMPKMTLATYLDKIDAIDILFGQEYLAQNINMERQDMMVKRLTDVRFARLERKK